MSTFGPAYDPGLDGERVQKQLQRIYRTMADGRWRTLAEIEGLTEDPQSSISAQLRHLRKPRFGAYVVEKRRRTETGGTWEYRLINGDDQEGIRHCRQPLHTVSREPGRIVKRCEKCQAVFHYYSREEEQ